MSRIINYSSAVTLTPTGYTTAGSYTFTHQTVANAYTDADSTTINIMTLAASRNSTRQSQLYYNFDTSLLSQIPSNATIDSVAANVKYYVSNTGYVTAVSIQLYSNTTAKGSAVTQRPTGTTGTKYSITTGNWTRSELQNARLYVSATHSASNSSAYLYFFGADLTVNYTVNGVEYEITATSEYDGASATPASQFIFQGGEATVRIETDTLDNMVLEDNGSDVTENLQYITPQQSKTATSVPTSMFTTGGTNGAQLYMSSTSTGSDWLEQAIGHSAESPNTTNTGHTYCKGTNNSSNASGWIIYNFDFSEIPEDAVIDSTEVKVYGSRENSTNDTTHRARVELYSGNSVKGSYYDLTSTSYSIVTIPTANTGTWTRAELQQAKLRFSVAYYGGRVNGITWNVNYHIVESPHYEYTISNINADHDVVFKEAVIVPPEEEPGKTYYSLTISSINATTEPGRGTIRIESGSSQAILIYPTDPLVTLIRDNGVDVSGQLVYHSGTSQPTYTVSTAQGASYGFTLNTGTGYYTSQNTGVNKSAAVSRIDFDLPTTCIVTFQFINYAEATYDFGVFGNVDATLSNNYYAAGSGGATITDSNYKLACNTSTYNTSSIQTLTYEIPSGQHYIYVKYSKDDASEANNDSLQWKISNIEMTSVSEDAHYEYTLSNINQDHSLIFIFGDVTYYFITSSGAGNARLYPDGQMVCLPGDTYKLTVVPENPEDIITATDNSSNITNNLERKEVVTEKNGQSALTVNYVYTLTNVQSAHTILVQDASATFYGVSASSTYIGATVYPSAQAVVEGRNITINIYVDNAYEINVKDNGVDVTQSLYETDVAKYSYTIFDVQSAHTVVVEEAPNVTITASSTYTNATATPATQKVYTTQNGVVTISTANYAAIDVKDNGTDVKSSLVSAGGNNYTYTLTTPTVNHTIVVSQKQYTVTASSSYASATISPASQTVLHGNSATITISGDIIPIKVLDNGTDITESLVKNGNTLTYTLTNVQTGHTIALSFVQTGFVKTSSGYAVAKKYYRKTAANTWTEITMAEFQTYKNNNTIFYN